MSQSSSFSSNSSSSGKCGYNKNFPRSFLLNYGAAIQDPKEEAILKRVHDFNCEWLQRPNIAISELAQTLRENLPLLQQYSGTIFTPEFVEDIASRFEPLRDVLSRLDNKDKSTSQPASREDVVSLLRTIDGAPEVEDFAINDLNAASPLFMICVHLLVPMTLMRNPEEFAEKARRTPQNAAFKEDPSPRRMRDFILNSITKRRRPASTASIWDALDEEDKDDAAPAQSSRRSWAARRASQARTRLPSAWQEQEPGADDDEEEETRPRRSRRSRPVSRKRRRSVSPPSSLEVLTQNDPVIPSGSKWKRPARAQRSSTPIEKSPASGKRQVHTTSAKPTPVSSSSSSSSSEDEAPADKKADKRAAKTTSTTAKGSSKVQSKVSGENPSSSSSSLIHLRMKHGLAKRLQRRN